MATPIGNLEDITLRALRVLREADVIACEDTRHTRHLLDHYGIETPTVSYHEHNEAERTAQLLDRLELGGTVALVSDAGTPMISDPGYRAVRAAAGAGIKVVPIPGPSALLASLAGSGLATDTILFGGFLPSKQGQRRKTLEQFRDLSATLVFFEAPHRLLDTLSDIEATLGNREIAVGRELTKLHEEIVRGLVSEVAGNFALRAAIKGEITLVLSREQPKPVIEETVSVSVARWMTRGLGHMEALKQVARERGVSKREIYQQELTEGSQ